MAWSKLAVRRYRLKTVANADHIFSRLLHLFNPMINRFRELTWQKDGNFFFMYCIKLLLYTVLKVFMFLMAAFSLLFSAIYHAMILRVVIFSKIAMVRPPHVLYAVVVLSWDLVQSGSQGGNISSWVDSRWWNTTFF